MSYDESSNEYVDYECEKVNCEDCGKSFSYELSPSWIYPDDDDTPELCEECIPRAVIHCCECDREFDAYLEEYEKYKYQSKRGQPYYLHWFCSEQCADKCTIKSKSGNVIGWNFTDNITNRKYYHLLKNMK